MSSNKNQSINFEEIYRHTLDQQIGGRSVDPLDESFTRHKVQDRMLDLIKRHGLLDVLISDLGLCSLCRDRTPR
ncbi:MAG: hypothetical protein WC147_01150 [Syntrophomonas sp.]